MFELLTVNKKDYKLKLTAMTTVLLEKKLKKNPLVVFLAMENGHMPSLEDTLSMLHCALQKYHADEFETESDTYKLFDDYVEAGGTMFDILEKVSDVVINAGFKPKEEEEVAEKN